MKRTNPTRRFSKVWTVNEPNHKFVYNVNVVVIKIHRFRAEKIIVSCSRLIDLLIFTSNLAFCIGRWRWEGKRFETIPLRLLRCSLSIFHWSKKLCSRIHSNENSGEHVLQVNRAITKCERGFDIIFQTVIVVSLAVKNSHSNCDCKPQLVLEMFLVQLNSAH